MRRLATICLVLLISGTLAWVAAGCSGSLSMSDSLGVNLLASAQQQLRDYYGKVSSAVANGSLDPVALQKKLDTAYEELGTLSPPYKNTDTLAGRLWVVTQGPTNKSVSTVQVNGQTYKIKGAKFSAAVTEAGAEYQAAYNDLVAARDLQNAVANAKAGAGLPQGVVAATGHSDVPLQWSTDAQGQGVATFNGQPLTSAQALSVLVASARMHINAGDTAARKLGIPVPPSP